VCQTTLLCRKVEIDFLYALVQSLARRLITRETALQTLAAPICANA
jgi:hypothetical protein